ncbi:MAG: hypothetical protein NTX24_05235 [Candidatus Pacearchaeota archaeon]|nr:hypothetical protein [Candidatus Pacearchaeota archaeon]
MKKILLILLASMIFLIFLFSRVLATCVVQGYVKGEDNNFQGSNIKAYCELDDSWKNITRNSGELYYVSWGGPADTCQSYCDNVYINGSNSTLGIWGYPYNETTLQYYFPINSSNTQEWNTGNTHSINLMIYDVDKTKPKTQQKNVSEEQQKKNQDNSMKELNKDIAEKYQSKKLNVNKVKNIMNYDKSLEENINNTSLTGELFWITWLNTAKRFFERFSGIK